MLTKDYFVSIAPGETRHIVPTIRLLTAQGKPGPVSPAELQKLRSW
jgi:hypothetical protein